MSKKKRKTRAEKETPKKYSFIQKKYTLNKDNKSESQEVASDLSKVQKGSSDSLLAEKDLKRVALLIGLMMFIFAILVYLIYKTSYFDTFFTRFNINY